MNYNKVSNDINNAAEINGNSAGILLEKKWKKYKNKEMGIIVSKLNFQTIVNIILDYNPSKPSSIPFIMSCELTKSLVNYFGQETIEIIK